MMILEHREKSWRVFLGTQDQYKEMVDHFLRDGGMTPMKDTFGKYCFDSRVIYPRYKIKKAFETYNEGKIAQRSIAKNENYATHIVYDSSNIRSILKNARKTTDCPKPELCVEYRYLNKSDVEILTHAYELATKYKHVKIIESSDFIKELALTKDRLSLANCDMVLNLLKGDDSAHKLGMEMMTNYDVEKSVLALMHVAKEGRQLNANEYFNSTAFKSFRKEFTNYTGISIEGMKYSGNIQYLLQRVGLQKLYLDPLEQKVLKVMILESLQNTVRQIGATLNLSEEDLSLNIPEDHLLELIEEPINS